MKRLPGRLALVRRAGGPTAGSGGHRAPPPEPPCYSPGCSLPVEEMGVLTDRSGAVSYRLG